MSNQDIVRKLQKLRVMAERATGPESENAKRLFDSLIDKYGMDADAFDAEDRKDYRVCYTREMKRWANHVGFSLGLEMRHLKKDSGVIFVNATPTEWEVYQKALEAVKLIYFAKKAEVMAKLNGYMYGFMHTAYPYTKEEPKCPTAGCDNTLSYSKEDRRYYCPLCGYKGKKMRKFNVDLEEIVAGKRDSGRLIAQ